MKKREQGVLTIEASIVLSFCVFVILFLLGFARVYTAQSMVSHGVLQASDAIAMESYLRETVFQGGEEGVVKMANRLGGVTSVSADAFKSLRSADVQKIAKEKFTYAISGNEAEADEKLKSVGVKDGLAGCNFAGTVIDLGNDDVIVNMTYTIKLQFPLFGWQEIEVTKAAKSKTFGDILFGLEVKPNDPKMGSASGGGQYKHGTSVQIAATPNYGYTFVKWDDGSTANPRTVTVTGSHTYVAIFKASNFGVNVTNAKGEGSVSGGGEYQYLKTAVVSATPATGYKFSKWTIYKHKDNTTTTSTSAKMSLTVDQTYTCKAYFEPKPYTIKVTTEGVSSSYASIVHNNKEHKSITLNYKTQFTLKASDLSKNGFKFKGWKIKDEGGIFSNSYSASLTVPAGDKTYVAVYEVIPSITITGGSTEVKSTTFKAETVPKNVTVNWSSSDTSSASVDNNGKVTVKKGSGKVNITATFKYNGLSISDSVTIELGESKHQVVYCMNMGNNGYRYYTKTHYTLAGTSTKKWGVKFNNSDNHHCYSSSVCKEECSDHANKIVGYTILAESKKVSSNSNNLHYVGKYSGYNKSGERGYIFNNGTGNAIYFELKQTTSGPRGFYIKKITN